MDAKQETLDLARELQDAINAASPDQLPSYREAAKNVTEALAALGAEFKFSFPGDRPAPKAEPAPKPAPKAEAQPARDTLDTMKLESTFKLHPEEAKALKAKWGEYNEGRKKNELTQALGILVSRHQSNMLGLFKNSYNLRGFTPSNVKEALGAIEDAFVDAFRKTDSDKPANTKLDEVRASLEAAYRTLEPRLGDVRAQLASVRRELEFAVGSNSYASTAQEYRRAETEALKLRAAEVMGPRGERPGDVPVISGARRWEFEWFTSGTIKPYELYGIYDKLVQAFLELDSLKASAAVNAKKAAFDQVEASTAWERNKLADQVAREVEQILEGQKISNPISRQGMAWMGAQTEKPVNEQVWKVEEGIDRIRLGALVGRPTADFMADNWASFDSERRRLSVAGSLQGVLDDYSSRARTVLENTRHLKDLDNPRLFGSSKLRGLSKGDLDKMLDKAFAKTKAVATAPNTYNTVADANASFEKMQRAIEAAEDELREPLEERLRQLRVLQEMLSERVGLGPRFKAATLAALDALRIQTFDKKPVAQKTSIASALGVQLGSYQGIKQVFDAYLQITQGLNDFEYIKASAKRALGTEIGALADEEGWNLADRREALDAVEDEFKVVLDGMHLHKPKTPFGRRWMDWWNSSKSEPSEPKSTSKKAEPAPKATVPDSQLHPSEGNPKAAEPPKLKDGDKVLVYDGRQEAPTLGKVEKDWSNGGVLVVKYQSDGRNAKEPAVYSNTIRPFDPAVPLRSIFVQFDKPKSQVTVSGPALKVALDLVVPLAKARSKRRDSRAENILFESKGGRLWVTATDLSTQVSQSIPAKGDEWSALVAYGKTFDALLTRMDESPEVTIGFSPFVETDPNKSANKDECVIHFSFGRAMSKLPRNNCLMAWDASVWATRTAPDSAGEVVDAEVMAEAMKRTAKALKTLDRSEDRAKYSGSFLVTATGEGYTFLGTDGTKITRTQMRHAGVGLLNQLAIESDVPNVYLDGAWDKKVHIQTEDMPGGQRKKVFFSDGDTVVSTLADIEKDGANVIWDEIKRIAGGGSSAGWLEVERAELVSALKLLSRRNDATNKDRFADKQNMYGVMLGAVNSNLHLIAGFTSERNAWVAESVPARGDGVIFAIVNKNFLLETLNAMKDRRVALGVSYEAKSENNMLWIKGEEGVYVLIGLTRYSIPKDKNGKPLPRERLPHVYGGWAFPGIEVSERELALRVVTLSEAGFDISETNASYTPGKQTLTPTKESDDTKKGKKASTKATKTTTKPAPKADPRASEQYKAGVRAAEEEAEQQRALKYRAAMEAYERDMEQRRAEAAATMERAKANKSKAKEAKPEANSRHTEQEADPHMELSSKDKASIAYAIEVEGMVGIVDAAQRIVNAIKGAGTHVDYGYINQKAVVNPSALRLALDFLVRFGAVVKDGGYYSLTGKTVPLYPSKEARRAAGFEWNAKNGVWSSLDTKAARAALWGWGLVVNETQKPMPAPTPEKPAPTPDRKTEGKPKNPNVIKVTPKGGELRITDTYPPPYPLRQARKAEGFAWDGDARCWIGPDNAKTRGACEAWGLKVGGEVLARDLVGKMGGAAKVEPKATPKADTKPKTEPKKADKGGIVETVKEAAASVVEAVMGKPDKKTKADKPKGGKKGGSKPKPKTSRPVQMPRSWSQIECLSGEQLRRLYPAALGKDASDSAKPAALRQEIAAALGITPPESCSHDKRVTVNLTAEARAKLAEDGGSVSGKIRDVLVKQGIEKRCKKRERRCGKNKKAA